MTNDLKARLGRRLFSLRSRSLMTQEELAEAAEISLDFVSLLERGQRAPSLRTLERLSEALGVSVRDLFDFEDEA